MRILCTETTPGLADETAARLGAAGHEVVRCFDPDGGPSRPCVGLDRDACPLDLPGGVDVVVDVRAPDRPRPTRREAGLTCALRQHVPMVLVGAGRPNPHARWTTVALDGGGDIVAACDEAIGRRLADLGATVSIAACRVLDHVRAEDRPGAAVRTEVERSGGDLHVLVHRPPTAAALDGAIAARAHRALRDAGVDVPSISIACAD